MSTTGPEAAPPPAEAKNKSSGKVRKRAPKACLSCRARKVRCDVSQRGRPCMNCYLDSETCVVTGRASRFRRAERSGDNVEISYPPYNADGSHQPRTAEDVVRSRLSGEPVLSKPEANLSPRADSEHGSCTNHQHNDVVESRPQDGSKSPLDSLHSNRDEILSLHQRVVPPPDIIDHNPAGNPSPLPPSASQGWSKPQRTPTAADITYSYYPFLAINNLHNIPPQDVNYLESQGCLRVPTREILDEFVKQYFLHVHTMLPMINEGDFWDMYGHYGHGGNGEKMSLLVFQSMLFVSSNFVSKESIKALGFPSIRVARFSLYRRCKLLYDMDTEFSMVHLSQAALLLSHWSPNFTHAFKKANSTWLSIAIQNAKSAEAHHYSAAPPVSSMADPIQSKKQNVLKRLWWSCIIRDRILPLGLRRSLKITRSHFDFDANPGLGYTDLADEIDRSKVYNSGTKRCLIEIFVQVVELCAVLTDIIMLVFPLDDSPGWGKQLDPQGAEKVRGCKHALRRWYKGATLRFPMFGGDAVPRTTITGGKEFQHDSVILYTNLMYMYYHSARVALSHHEVLQTAVAAVSPNLTSNLKEFSSIYENRHELQDAASGVTECLKELIQLRLARWLPISAVASTALPLVLHIIDVKLSSFNQSQGSLGVIPNPQEALKQHRLNILIEAMKTYEPQYDGVDYVSETIRHIVTLAQLDTPAPPSSTPSIISDWQDILASQPGCYLRLAMTMDLSLSKGRLPEEADFPASLRGLFTAGYSSVRALMGAGKMNLTPLPEQVNQNFSFGDAMSFNPASFSVAVPGTVQSLSSEADSESPSLDDQATVHRTLTHDTTPRSMQNGGRDQNNALLPDHGFVDAALQMEGLAGGVLAGYPFNDEESPGSSGLSVSDLDGTMFENDETNMMDWVGGAWGGESEHGVTTADGGDRETAQALLDALKGSEQGIGVECGA
ncbi:hypothetical protein BX600DRAFT_492282 [Xylariales sp. PMI_506]|nr:hypothetical protein BX600DRAFT_492282 [Xylariales sp. PMI_506]